METPFNETPKPTETSFKPKRKREAKLKPLIETPETLSIPFGETIALPATVQETKTTLKQKAVKKPRKKKFVASKFDKTIAKLVVRGERSAGKIRDALRVDPEEFERELARLCDEGLMVRGKFDDDYLSFTVKGFDLFASFFNKTLEKESEAAEAATAASNLVWDARQTLLKTEEEAREKERTAEKEKENEKDALHKALAQDRALLSASLSEEKNELDLEDAFKKGAPNCNDAANSKRSPKGVCPTPEKQKNETKTRQSEKKLQLEVDAVTKNEAELKKALEAEIAKGAAMRVGENEVCELCRAPFKIGVGTANAAQNKFGHCFCGAAYHKDCFETLATEQEGKCVRCGKKLKIAMDARSEEAVKELKNVF